MSPQPELASCDWLDHVNCLCAFIPVACGGYTAEPLSRHHQRDRECQLAAFWPPANPVLFLRWQGGEAHCAPCSVCRASDV